jgi:tetratricopeptide (TPR) repeat protein
VVRLSTALVAFGKYVLLFVFPKTLSAEYSFDQVPLAHGPADPRALVGLALLAAAGLIAVGRLRARPPVSLGMALFLVALLPVSHLLFPVNVILAERLLYLPSVGLSLAAAAWAAPRLDGRAARWAAVVVVTLLGVRAAVRDPVWADDATLFEHTVRDAPRSAKAWAALGAVRAEQERPDEARACFERALEIQPRSYAALDGLGHLALERGAWTEALARFQEAARVSPAEPAPLCNAGVVHLRGGNPQRAIEAFEAALKLDPHHAASVQGLAAAWQTLGVRLAEAGRLEDAAEALEKGTERVRELGGDTAGLEATLADVRRDLGAP